MYSLKHFYRFVVSLPSSRADIRGTNFLFLKLNTTRAFSHPEMTSLTQDSQHNELNCYNGTFSARFRLQADKVVAAPECGKVFPSAVTIDFVLRIPWLYCWWRTGWSKQAKRDFSQISSRAHPWTAKNSQHRRRSSSFRRNRAPIFAVRFIVVISSNYIATPSF